MADLPSYPDPNSEAADDDTGAEPDLGSSARTPRWVYAFGVIALVLGLLFVILHLTGGGFRGHIP